MATLTCRKEGWWQNLYSQTWTSHWAQDPGKGCDIESRDSLMLEPFVE